MEKQVIKFKTVRGETVILILKNVLYLTTRKEENTKKETKRYELAIFFVDGSLTKFTIEESELENIKSQLSQFYEEKLEKKLKEET